MPAGTFSLAPVCESPQVAVVLALLSAAKDPELSSQDASADYETRVHSS